MGSFSGDLAPVGPEAQSLSTDEGRFRFFSSTDNAVLPEFCEGFLEIKTSNERVLANGRPPKASE